MGFGIDWMILVTQWVAALPGAIGRMAAFGTGPLIASTAGIILLGLLRSPLRWAGAGIVALSIIWALTVPQPDVLISGDGQNVGVRGRDGRLHVMRGGKDTFLLKEWLAGDADARSLGDPTLGDGVSCDAAGCVAQLPDGALAALALRPDALADDCERAAVVVSARQAPAACRAMVIDRSELQKRGAIALRRTSGGFAIDAIRPKGVDRPWSPAVDAKTDVETTVARPRISRPVDATPADGDLQAED